MAGIRARRRTSWWEHQGAIRPRRDADLDRFLRNLATAWKDGEVRPTHRSEPKSRRYWRTRPDLFEAVWCARAGWMMALPASRLMGVVSARAERRA
jgi:hypothetical protein